MGALLASRGLARPLGYPMLGLICGRCRRHRMAVDASRALSLKLYWCCTLLTQAHCCVQRCKSCELQRLAAIA
jgi:hypothetical protein